MSIALDVARHNITEEYPWPADVSELFRRFSRPLPKLLASIDFLNALPLRTRKVLEEALQSPLLALEDEESDNGEGRPVSDLIDNILSSVRIVRAARAFGRGEQQARFSWTSLITMIGLTISENVHFAEDVSFLKPRTIEKSKPRDSGDLEGKAVVLLSTFIPRTPRPDSDPKGPEGNKSDPATSESNERPLQDSFVALDLPFDAYVTPGRGKRVDCCLPVVCAADEDEIESLVTSVVCQRFVWNMPIPVVGVSLSKSRTTATVVIGWSEVDTRNPDASPVVHIASSESQDNIQPSLGVFDLIDPVSALYFGQFILGLHSHFVSVERLSKNRDVRYLCWRLDHVQHDPLSKCSWLSEADTSEETWLRNIGPAAHAESSLFHRPLSASANMSDRKPDSSKDLLQVRSQPSGVSASSRSGHSASKFAAIPEKDLALMEEGTDTWLWERSTLRLFNIKLPANDESEFSKQFNEMIDLYDELTKFAWPKGWRGKNTMPYCDPPSRHQREKLFDDYKEFHNNTDAPADLEPSVTEAVANHMTSFLRIVSIAQVVAHQAAFSGASESAMRSAWDDMFRAACCSPTEDISPTYFLGKTIGLPTNKALEDANFPDLFQSRIYAALLLQQFMGTKMSDSIHGCVLSAYQQALYNKTRSENGAFTVGNRSGEPSTALADSLYCYEHLVPKTAVKESKPKPNGSSPGWVPSFFGVFKKPSQTRCAKGQDRTLKYEEPSTEQTMTITFKDAHSNCRPMCSEVSKSSPYPSSFTIKDDNDRRFYFPFIFIENKSASKTFRQALHQCQMYCVFGVEFLATFGITDFPVFGVVTAATEGEIIMVWKSSKSAEADYRSAYQPKSEEAVAGANHRFNVMVDRNCMKFDLTSPLQAFHFYISIHRIFKRQELLPMAIRQISSEFKPVWKNPVENLLRQMMDPKESPPQLEVMQTPISA